MTNLRFRCTSLALSLALAAGCEGRHPAARVDAGTDMTSPPVPHADAGPLDDAGTADAAPPALSPLERCLTAAGTLVEIASVDNNDVTAHGDVRAFALSSARVLAVASQDGTLKFWTLEGFLGAVDPASLTYGKEIAAAANDLVWSGDEVLLADNRGLVSGWTVTGAMRIVGGAEPDVPLVALALDGPRARIAHADDRAGGHVVVRSLAGGAVVGPLPSEVDAVRDLAFTPAGALVIAGGDAGDALVELWPSTDAKTPGVAFRSPPDTLGEIAAASGVIVATTSTGILVFDDALTLAHRVTLEAGAQARTIDLTPHGAFAVFAAVDGRIGGIATGPGAPLALAAPATKDPVSLRIDASGDLVFVAHRAGQVRVLECRP